MDLNKKTNAELVELYNGLVADKPIKSWKGKKEVLIDRIRVAQAKAAPADTPPPKPKRKRREGDGPARDVGAVRRLCEKLLAEVSYYEDRTKPVGPDNRVKGDHPNARAVGLSFSEILGRVQEKMRGAKTSYACLRWYAVHMRKVEGNSLPARRDKSSWK